MKKRILALMAVMTAGFASVGFASCGDKNKDSSTPTCEHTNVQENLTAATCTDKGQLNKVCLDCDYVFPAEEIPALGHDFGASEVLEATCSSAKTEQKQCNRCSEIVVETIGEALGHDYKLVGETAATCTDPAVKNYECDRDGCTSTKTEPVDGGDALGHNYVHMVDKDTAATCTQAGEEVWECTNDGCEDAYCNVVAPLDHLPENAGIVSEPTCTEKGYTSMHCTRPECGEDYKINLVPELGHNLVDGASITASCDTMGYDRQVCDRDGCSYEVRSNVVENTAHNFNNNGVCSDCGKGAMDAFALTCADADLYSIEKVGDEYIVYAPSYKYYTYVKMPANVLQALYAQGVYSFNVLLGSRTDSETKAMALNIQGGQDINVNVLANEMKEMTTYTFADKDGIFDKDKDGITFGVYYRVKDELTSAIGETKVSAYAISFQYNITFNSENVDSYFKTSLSYTYNKDSEVFTFTDVNNRGNNTVTVRQELLQYYYDQGYRTLDITLATAIGQHFAKNLTASATGMETMTTGDKNDMTTTLEGIDIESILSGDLKLDIYCIDNYGTDWNPDSPMDSFLLSFKWKAPIPAFDAENTATYLTTDLKYTYSESSDLFAFTNVNTAGYNTVFVRQELLQYYYDQGYRTLNVTLNTALGQRFSNNMTATATGMEAMTTGSTNNLTVMLEGIDIESILSGDLKLDIYCSDLYGTEWNPENPMDSFLLNFKWIIPDPEFNAEDTATYFKTDLTYESNDSSDIYTFTNVNNAGYNTIIVRQELLQYYLDNGYKTLTIKVNSKAGQHFSKNLTAKYGDNQSATSGDTNGVAVIQELSLEALVNGNLTLDIYAIDNYGRAGFEAFNIEAPMDAILLTLKFEKEKQPVTVFTSGNGQIADYQDDVAVTAGNPTYTATTATMTYDFQVVDHTYTFINFDAKIINEMMAKGYTNVRFNVNMPAAGYINARLNGTGFAEGIEKAYGAVASVEFDSFALTADGTYNVRLYLGETTDVTVTATFTKSVTAFTSGNGYITDYAGDVAVTVSEPTYGVETATMTYAFNVVNHTYTFLNFDATLINDMIAKGYTKVTFSVALPSARYVNARLNGTGLETVTKEYGAVANVGFDEFALTADGSYNIRFYFGEVTDVIVTATFEKAVTAFTSSNGVFTNYGEALEVTAATPVYADDTATMAYNVEVVNHTYAFLSLDTTLINDMIAKGYTKVTLKVALPTARYINATLDGTGLTATTKEYGAVANVEFDEFALTADGSYNIRFYFGEITNVTVTAVFSK